MRLFARLSGTLSDRWWFALPVFALLLLTPTLLHGQPFLFWDTEMYYHYGAQLVGFVTTKIGPTIGLNVVERSETAKQRGVEPDQTSFDKALIDQKSRAGGMATYSSRWFYSMWLYLVASVFNLWAVLTTQAVATAWIIWRNRPTSLWIAEEFGCCASG